LKVSPEFDDHSLNELVELLEAQHENFWLVTMNQNIIHCHGNSPDELLDLLLETFGLT